MRRTPTTPSATRGEAASPAQSLGPSGAASQRARASASCHPRTAPPGERKMHFGQPSFWQPKVPPAVVRLEVPRERRLAHLAVQAVCARDLPAAHEWDAIHGVKSRRRDGKSGTQGKRPLCRQKEGNASHENNRCLYGANMHENTTFARTKRTLHHQQSSAAI